MTSKRDVEEVGRLTRNFLHDEFYMKGRVAYDSTLCGLCAIGSFAALKVMRRLGSVALFVIGTCETGSHAWLEVATTSEVLCLDTTATQFGSLPSVIVLSRREFIKQPHMVPFAEYITSGDEALRDAMCWRDQNPFCYEHIINSFVEDALRALQPIMRAS